MKDRPLTHLPSTLEPLLTPLMQHLGGVLAQALEHRAPARCVVVWDEGCDLAALLAHGYQQVIPDAVSVAFRPEDPAPVLAALGTLRPGDLAVLVQSSSFRLDAFRFRVELFKRGLKVVEHPHLARMTSQEVPTYVASLAYDAAYFRGVGRALAERLEHAPNARLVGGDAELVYAGGFEVPRLNVGDYAGMPNVGGQFPIGEVFSEAVALESVNGRVKVFAFGDEDFRVNVPERPITLVVERGRVARAEDSTPPFDAVLAAIVAHEEPWVRELGFGLNRAFSPTQRVSDIGTFERMCGVHLSLGAKHGLYPKEGLRRKDGRFHVDVFAQVDAVFLGNQRVFAEGAWTVVPQGV